MRCEDLYQHPEFRSLSSIDGIAVDLRYGGINNFVQRNLYGELDCHYLHVQAAHGLELAALHVQKNYPDYRILVLDAVRPHRVQETLWAHFSGTSLRQYLADPEHGSIHSYGMALDATIIDRNGVELDMGSAFDELAEKSQPVLEQRLLAQGELSVAQVSNRQLLRTALCSNGFCGIHKEWWHFNFGDAERVRKTLTRID